MTDNTTIEQWLYVQGRKVAKLKNNGALCAIQRRNSGFLYGPHRVSVAEELLETLPDTTIMQFTNTDSGDVWTINVYDFRHASEPIQLGNYEPQRACEIARMNHTIEGKPKRSKKRVNELVHVDQKPTQPTLFERLSR